MIDVTFAKLALILVNLSIVGCILFLVYQAIMAQLKLEASFPEHAGYSDPGMDLIDMDSAGDEEHTRQANPYDYMIARKRQDFSS